MKVTKIDSIFMGNFLVGDNINYNLKIVQKLYETAYISDSFDSLFNKPVLMITIPVIETLYWDLIHRIRKHTRENSVTLKPEILEKIRILKKKDIRTFFDMTGYTHQIFGQRKPGFISILKELREVRNRIHIQNDRSIGEKRDNKVFTSSHRKNSEQMLEFIMRYFAKYFPRPPNKRCVDEFILPWRAYFDKDLKRIRK